MRAPSAIATQVGDSPVSEINVEELPENLLLKPRLGGASVCEFDWLSHGPIVRGAAAQNKDDNEALHDLSQP
jgi:hypothetical protein